MLGFDLCPECNTYITNWINQSYKPEFYRTSAPTIIEATESEE